MDTQALDRFLESVERRAFRMAEIATGNREEALDIVQDAMLGLASRYADRTPAEWGPLFHQILQTRITDWYRRSGVRRRWRVWLTADDEARGDPLENQPDLREPGPERELASAHVGDELDAALRALPPRQCQAFLLRVWEGLGVADTARAMNCSEGSVKTHFSRAVHALRERLEAHYDLPR